MVLVLLTSSCSLSYSKGEAAAIETELLRDYRFGQQQLIEIWGQACAIAITKVCTSPFVVSLHAFVSISLFFFPACSLLFIASTKQNTAQGKFFLCY